MPTKLDLSTTYTTANFSLEYCGQRLWKCSLLLNFKDKSRSQKDVREMEEIVQSRTERNVGETTETVQLRKVEEIEQPRP
ncbi:protein SCAR3 [Cucumis melo var. makuwa]|uniref:Protein SCAR3 n=1 Tax=Cucumis melo var. makuwa TaxID=1194695 RepID=A0A5D3CPL0_CUCMM|nr:protein SCAR3 [Cucumis melo var. makuwa]TYK12366.1 protein SCAR3 [Cucumis melo var. makuwa]